MTAPRKTFTRNQLDSMGLPFNAELIRSFHDTHPDIQITDVFDRCKLALEQQRSQIVRQLLKHNDEADACRSRINDKALDLSIGRDAYLKRLDEFAALEQACDLLDSEIASLSADSIANAEVIRRLRYELGSNRSKLNAWKKKLIKARAELVNESGSNVNNNNETECLAQEEVNLNKKLEFSDELERLITESRAANKQLSRINKLIADKQEQLQQFDKTLLLLNQFDLHNPFISINSIEAMIFRMRTLANFGLPISQQTFEQLELIAQHFKKNKNNISGDGTKEAVYAHLYNFNPQLLLQIIIQQFNSVIKEHDDNILHNQSDMVRRCIAAMQRHVEIVNEQMKQEDWLADHTTVKKFYRKMLAIAQLYYQRLHELNENYLAGLIFSKIVNQHLLYEEDVLNEVRKNDFLGSLFATTGANDFSHDQRLDVEPFFDFINEGQLEQIECRQFRSAREALEKKLNEMNQTDLLVPMVRLFKQEIENEFRQSQHHNASSFDIKFHANWLRVTTELLKSPADNIDKFMNMLNVNTIGKSNISRRKKTLAIAVLGAAIFAGGLSLGCLSLGVLSPISIAVMSVGLALTVSSVSVALTTGQKGLAEYGESVAGITMFNQRKAEAQQGALQVHDVRPVPAQ